MIDGTGVVSGTGWAIGQGSAIGSGAAAGQGSASGTGFAIWRGQDGHLNIERGTGSVSGRGIAFGTGSASGTGVVRGTGTADGSGSASGTSDATSTDTGTANLSQPIAVDGSMTYTTQSGEWEITQDDKGTVTYHNTVTDQTVTSSGDPHVEANDQSFTYKTDALVALPNSDGTTTYVKVDNEPTASGDADAATYHQGITIYDPVYDASTGTTSYAVVSTNDSNLNESGGLTVQTGEADALPDRSSVDGPMVTITSDGEVQTRDGFEVTQDIVDQYESGQVAA